MKKQKNILVSIFFLIASLSLHSQTSECGTVVNPYQILALPVTCTQLLRDFIPTTPENAVEVYVNVWVFQPAAGPGSWGTPTNVDVDTLIKNANYILANMPLPKLPVAGVPFLSNAKIKLIKKNFQIVPSDFLYNDITQAQYNNSFNDPNAINISFGNCVGGIGGFCTAFVQTIPSKFIYFAYSGNQNLSTRALVLCHELGHALGNNHTTLGEGYSIASNNFGCCNQLIANDVTLENPVVWATCSDPFGSNNIMSQNAGCMRYLSPLQMAIMHYTLRSPFIDVLTPASQTYVKNVNLNCDIDITSSQIWQNDFDRYMKGNLIIKAGSTLTMKCKTYMTMGSKIIVEKGARLIIDGGEATSWYPNTLWKGIEIEGTYGECQLVYNPTGLAQFFGIIKVINGGTIRNAHNGITNARSDVNGNIMWGNQGGIIQGDNGNFINNIRDVQFLAYSGGCGNDLSKFTKCNFSTTSALNTNALPIGRVSLWEVWGVSFLGCNFIYSAGNAYGPNDRGYGIFSINAKYTVDRVCNNISNPCNSFTNSQFKNLTFGVRVDNTNPLKVVSIKNSDFYDNTSVGAYFNTVYYPVFENNYVRTPGDNAWCAVYINNCKYYNVKNNTLVQDYGLTPYAAGIYVSNSQSGAHQIYRNNFSNFYMAIGAIGDNSGPTNYIDGLKMNCNDFTPIPNKWDVALVSTAPTVMYVQGQGYVPLMTPTNLVRNKYAANCIGNENKWYIQGNSVKNVMHGTNGSLVCRPDVPSAACKDVAVGVVPINMFFDYANNCLPYIIPNGCTPPCLTPINIALNAAITQVNNLTVSYNSSIDGGNTQALLNSINSNISEGDLKNLMLQYSPYLSDAVLSAYFSRTHFPLGHGVQIQNANKPVSSAVWEIIVNRDLAGGIMSQLTSQQNENPVSARGGKEQELSLAKFNLQAITAEKLNYFLTDSLISSQDSVISILLANPGKMLDADVQLVFAYLNKGDYSNALISANKLLGETNQGKIQWGNLLVKIVGLRTAVNKDFSILDNSADVNFFTTYANTEGISGQGSAQALLKFVTNHDYFIPRPIPEISSNGARSSIAPHEQKNVIIPNDVLLYPNPAQTGINLVYRGDKEGVMKVEVTDLLGKVIFSNFIYDSTKLYISLTDFNAGLYLITVTKDKEVIFKSKLIKQD